MNLKEKKTRIFIDLKRNIYWMRTVEKANTTVINIMMSNLFVRSIPKQNKTRIDSIFRENESSQQNNMDGFRLWGRKITIIMNLVWIIFGYWEEESLPACVQWSDWLFFVFHTWIWTLNDRYECENVTMKLWTMPLLPHTHSHTHRWSRVTVCDFEQMIATVATDRVRKRSSNAHTHGRICELTK